MRFLIHGNAPWVSTGYGVQGAHLAPRLKALGHDVAFSSTYGQQGSTAKWRDINVYPAGYDVNSNDVIHGHALHHFRGDVESGWLITLIDVWALVNPLIADFQVAAWVPVDHFPAPRDVLKFFHLTGAVPVAMSEFGENLLREAGLDPTYIPLSVDMKVYKPTPMMTVGDRSQDTREVFKIPADAFVVGMVAMNKGWARDRKGFNEAFRAFAVFWQHHQDAVLLMHSEQLGGAEGINLLELAAHAGIPEHALIWSDQYAYRMGFSAEMMAATYTTMDVLLSPSHGEGFCVPLVEAQACGTPVIATDFSAQPELVCDPIRVRMGGDGLEVSGATPTSSGWLVDGQPEWDPPQHASYVCPRIDSVVVALELAYRADRDRMGLAAQQYVAKYDTDRVFQEHWVPFLATLEPPATEAKDPIPDAPDAVAVIVPALMRPHNVQPLVDSVMATTLNANVYFVCDPADLEQIAAVEASGARLLLFGGRDGGFAEKMNYGVANTTEPWVVWCGDDVRFHPGWMEEARRVSERADVIGTNDSLPGRVRNPDVAAGRHADHFLVRRSYIDDVGACLDGPGILAPEAYGHWYCDKEVIGLAKARGVYVHCGECVLEHLHPGYDNGERDQVYLMAIESAEPDRKEWLSRLPLVEMQRTTRAKVR